MASRIQSTKNAKTKRQIEQLADIVVEIAQHTVIHRRRIAALREHRPDLEFGRCLDWECYGINGEPVFAYTQGRYLFKLAPEFGLEALRLPSVKQLRLAPNQKPIAGWCVFPQLEDAEWLRWALVTASIHIRSQRGEQLGIFENFC